MLPSTITGAAQTTTANANWNKTTKTDEEDRLSSSPSNNMKKKKDDVEQKKDKANSKKKRSREEKKKKKRKHSGNFHLNAPSFIIQIQAVLPLLHLVANPGPGQKRKKVRV